MAENDQRRPSQPVELSPKSGNPTQTLLDERIFGYRMWALGILEQVRLGELTSEQAADTIAKVRYAADLQIEQTRRDSFRDPLTGLPNKGVFNQRIEQLVAEGRTFSLLFIDIDDFKKLNSNYGYPLADEVLVQVGLTLSSKTKTRHQPHEDDLVARWGGEEFAILLFDVPSQTELLSIAERHRSALGKSYRVDGPGLDEMTTRTIPITASVAGAIYRGGNIDEFFINVNKALRQIKEEPMEDGQIHKNRCIILDNAA